MLEVQRDKDKSDRVPDEQDKSEPMEQHAGHREETQLNTTTQGSEGEA